jgi:hypothetical protein
LEKYAALLKKAWHIIEACEVYRRILTIDPMYHLDEKIQNLEIYEQHLNDVETCIIEPDIELTEIIKSSTAIGKLFKGRYLIRKLDKVKYSQAEINPDLFVNKYEKNCHDYKGAKLPTAMHECVWMISRDKVEKSNLVTFLEDKSSAIQGLQFALEIITCASETVVIPELFFDRRNPSLQEPIDEVNRNASIQLDRIIKNNLSTPYIISHHRAANMILRRLFTEKISHIGESTHAFRL